MYYYLSLQLTRLQRLLKSMGIHPLVALLLGLPLFVLLSKVLFYKLDAAEWIYGGMAVFVLLKLSERSRNDLLHTIFDRQRYRLLRLLENGMLTLPFLVLLLLEKELLVAGLLSGAAAALAFYTIRPVWGRSLFTPFRKYPFEFIAGFRKWFWLLGGAYFLLAKAVQVDNFNLGLFALALLFLNSMLFYQKPEAEYFVWIYTGGIKRFLQKKFIAMGICLFLLTTAALIVLLVFFSENWLLSTIGYVLGYIFVGSMILAKYSAFPHEMNVPQGLFYAVSLLFPPFLLLAIWIFYRQTRKRLKPILE